MSELPKHLRDLLFLVSYLRKNPGALVRDVAKVLKVPPDEVVAYVNSLVLCGKPPFSPGDFIDIEISHERLHLQLDQKLGKPLRFTPQEAIALTVALRTIAESKTERFAAVAKDLLKKTRAKLGEDVAKRVDAVQPHISVSADANEVEARLRALQRALDGRRVVEIVYWSLSRDAISTRRVRPLLTVDHAGTWYLIAHDEKSSQERVFRLDRIGEVNPTEDRFVPPKDFDPKKYRVARMFLPGAEVRQARVLLHASVAPAFRDRWLPREVTVRKGGDVEATIDYVSPNAIAAWILPYGPLAEVLGPPEVRDAVLERARALREQYA
jgi:proteasome accessory factor C